MILSWPHCRGCIGSTPAGCTAPSTTSPQSSTRPSTTVRSTPDSSRCRENPPSTKPGAVHFNTVPGTPTEHLSPGFTAPLHHGFFFIRGCDELDNPLGEV